MRWMTTYSNRGTETGYMRAHVHRRIVKERRGSGKYVNYVIVYSTRSLSRNFAFGHHVNQPTAASERQMAEAQVIEASSAFDRVA